MGTCLLSSSQHAPAIPRPYPRKHSTGSHRGIFGTGGNLKVIKRIPLDVQDIPSVPTDLGVVRVQLSRLQNSVTGIGGKAGGMMPVLHSVSQSSLREQENVRGRSKAAYLPTPWVTLGESLHFSEPSCPPWYGGGCNECFTGWTGDHGDSLAQCPAGAQGGYFPSHTAAGTNVVQSFLLMAWQFLKS